VTPPSEPAACDESAGVDAGFFAAARLRGCRFGGYVEHAQFTAVMIAGRSATRSVSSM